jgi:hypothetical protein
MPRANRHFLPGYVWHITHLMQETVPTVQVVQSLRFVQNVSGQARSRSKVQSFKGSKF